MRVSDVTPRPAFAPNDILRLFLELAAVVIVAIWGFTSWPFPWNIAFGIAAPALVVLIWALFQSPRAVIHFDVFGRALIEIIVMFGASLALWHLGSWIGAVILAVISTVSGLVHGLRSLNR